MRLGIVAVFAVACATAAGAEARQSVGPDLRPAPRIQLVQTCTCQNPVGIVGETVCRRQRIVRCRGTTRNVCSWQETNERC